MERYVGMDVSLEETSICVVDGKGEIVSEGSYRADIGIRVGRVVSLGLPAARVMIKKDREPAVETRTPKAGSTKS